ncbi:MAG: VOC family protein [Eubacterium sp.]
MTIGAVNHIGINTIDFQASIDFYQNVMGLPFLGEYDLGGDYVAYFRVNETTTLELFRTDGNMEIHEPGDCRIGLKHLAFDVDDVDAWCAYLKEKNYVITYGSADIPPISKRVLLFQAPDNVIIELCCDA